MIQLKNIDRSYKLGAGQLWVLRRIQMDIQPGEFITIMGPSGSGKSSLLNILGLLDDDWQGEYWFGEQPVHKLNRKQRADLSRRSIGMVFQSYHLLDDLTVAENIDLPLSYKNIPTTERQGMVADVLDRFRMVAKKDLFPSSFPAASSNWSVSPARSFTSPRCCWPTSPPAISTPYKPKKSWSCSGSSTAKVRPSFRLRIRI